MSVDLGDLPGWITTAIALGGVLFGGYNLRKLTRDRMRTQAERVYFGHEFKADSHTIVHVINLSDAPVTNLELYFRSYPEFSWEDRTRKSLLMMNEEWEIDLNYPDDVSWVMSYVSFTDASNRTWYKMSNGKLYAHDVRPNVFLRLRYFIPTWLINLRTWHLSPSEKEAWLVKHGFLGGLFRWAFGKQFE